jgi:hypothetical protein
MIGSQGDYSQSMIIDFNTLCNRTQSRDANFQIARKKSNYAIATLVAGTITTIALAIFTSPVFAIIASISTLTLTAYLAHKSNKHHAIAQADQNFLTPYIITKTHIAAAGDTYDDSCLNKLYKARILDGTFHYWDDQQSGLLPVYQNHTLKRWMTGSDIIGHTS